MDNMRDLLHSRLGTILKLLLLSSLLSIAFSVVNALATKSTDLTYLLWNLLLAWLPIFFVGCLLVVLGHYPWLNWRPVILTALWVGFLPNSFYLVSDLIHLQGVSQSQLVFDSVMFETFVINGLLVGYLSVWLVHRQLLRRVSTRMSTFLIGLTFFVCSFAIYLGRDLRLSSWDLLLNPPGILFDSSVPLVSPRSHLQAFSTTLTFFVFLSVLYIVIWKLLSALTKHSKNTDQIVA
jgi:uncharacterized membrane protein